MGVRTHDTGPRSLRGATGPGLAPALAVAVFAFVLLMANGRFLGPPQEGGLTGLVLRFVLAGADLFVEMDTVGRALVGKGLAALAAAGAAGALFAGVARRHPLADARIAGLVLAVGTSLASASQSWSGEAPATAAIALALLFLVRAEGEDDPRLAARAVVPLALAVAFAPATWLLALVLLASVFARFPRAVVRLLAWSVPATAVAVAAGALGGAVPWSRGEATGAGSLALLISPARGALVFTPVALVGVAGLVRALGVRSSRFWDAPATARWLPLTALVAALAHVVWVALRGDASTGPSWGPPLFTPAWPALLLFLPEGVALLRPVGAALVALSVGVQALGAFAYDGRWDRLYGVEGRAAPATWNVLRSPIAFQLRERVVRPALFALVGGRLVVREHPIVLGGPTGSRVTFAGDAPTVEGADTTIGDVLLEGGARVVDGRLRLAAPDDALFLRVREGARPRRLELRVRGRGPGTLAVEEKTFWTAPRGRERAVGDVFRLRLPYVYAESGGGDLRILAHGGSLEVESVALVPPSEPDNVIRLR